MTGSLTLLLLALSQTGVSNGPLPIAFGGLVLSLFLPATGLPSHALRGQDEAAV